MPVWPYYWGEGLMIVIICSLFVSWLVASHRQRGHLETATLFTVPCEGREAQF